MSDAEKIQALRDAYDNWYIDHGSVFCLEEEDEEYYEKRY